MWFKKLNEENSVVVQGVHRETQWFTGDDRGVQGMTEAYSSTQGMCTVADRGLQGEQGLCTGKWQENTGKTGDFQTDRGF